jgi:hypothetical protein
LPYAVRPTPVMKLMGARLGLSSSFRDGPKDQTRNSEIPGSMLRIAPE